MKLKLKTETLKNLRLLEGSYLSNVKGQGFERPPITCEFEPTCAIPEVLP